MVARLPEAARAGPSLDRDRVGLGPVRPEEGVAHRVEAYRTRRRRLRNDPAQPEFPFDEPAQPAQLLAEPQRPAPAPLGPLPAIRSWRYRPVHVDRMEIDLAQPAIDFAEADELADHTALGSSSQDAFVPVATLAERRMAGLIDAALLLFAPPRRPKPQTL